MWAAGEDVIVGFEDELCSRRGGYNEYVDEAEAQAHDGAVFEGESIQVPVGSGGANQVEVS